MESVTFDLDKSSASLEKIRKRTTDAFLELRVVINSTIGLMGRNFSTLAQGINFEFYKTCVNLQEFFDNAFLSMTEGAAGFWMRIDEDTTEVLAGLDASFSETWNSIGESVKEFWDQFSSGFAELLLGINEGFSELWIPLTEETEILLNSMRESAAALWQGLNNGFAVTWASINSNAGSVLNSVNGNATNLCQNLNKRFAELWASTKMGADFTWQTILMTASGLQSWADNGFTALWNRINERFQRLKISLEDGNKSLWDTSEKGFSSLTGRVKGNFFDMWNYIREGSASLWQNTGASANALIVSLYNNFAKMWKDVSSGMRNMARDACNVLSRLISWSVNPINEIIRGVNKISFINIPELRPTISPPTFAQGGFPAQGQMFIAREAGPELVGSIGSRSAVVNNDQIVESVSRGVSNAVTAAMNGSGDYSNKTPLEFNLYLDGNEITSTVERAQQRRLLQTNGALA